MESERLSLTATEAKILRSKRSYRGQRVGATFLFVMFAISAAGHVADWAHRGETSNFTAFFLLAAVLFAGIASQAHARLDHISTLERLTSGASASTP